MSIEPTAEELFIDLQTLIEQAKKEVHQSINKHLTMLYWYIGKRINEELLQNKRSEYGKQILPTLSAKLTEQYGKSYSARNLNRMINFSIAFSQLEKISSLADNLSWSHFIELIPIHNELERQFYTQLCRVERWSVRTLRDKKRSMLFERTAISQKPEELARIELQNLEQNNILSPDLVFKNPYILDFLNLKNVYQEKDLEQAILRQLEDFLLELGRGFAFLERQKRMIIDGKDFKLDLLFYHRKLKRLVAIDLKIGQFEAAYKGQMELYLRWLEKHETEPNEEPPIGLLLCAEGNNEQIELLQLDKSNIRVAEYMTKQLPKELLKQKLHQFIQNSKHLLDNQTNTNNHEQY